MTNLTMQELSALLAATRGRHESDPVAKAVATATEAAYYRPAPAMQDRPRPGPDEPVRKLIL
jgi:hypothetical protein